MTILVVGATGETGRPLVEQLLAKNHEVRVIVRSPNKFSAEVLDNPNLTVIEASVLDLTDDEMTEHVADCEAVVSCLGHVMNFKGMFGSPRKLCRDAALRLCGAIERNRPSKPTKFILMNTVAVENHDLNEQRSLVQRMVLGLFGLVLPPHSDNVAAAEHLRRTVGKANKYVEWCSVRPEALIDAEVSRYDVRESPIEFRFSGHPTTRSNVAHFMIELVENGKTWNTWKFRMPTMMNSEPDNSEESR